MPSVLYNLFQNFVLGGATIAGISFIGTFVDPLLGAIVWSFPISLLPTLYFMKKNGKSNDFVARFTTSTTFTIGLLALSVALLSYFIKNNKDSSIALPIIKMAGLWLLASFIFFIAIKHFKLADKFM